MRYPDILIACASQRRQREERKEAYRRELEELERNNQLNYEQERNKWTTEQED